VDEGKEAVLMLGFAAADLVDEDRLGFPDGGRGFEIADLAAVIVRIGEADQVVKVDQAGVVVPVFEV